MGIQINGQTDRISAVDGSFSIQDLAEVNVTGVATASNFKTGTSNVHSTGYECANINATGIVTAASANFTGNVSVGGTLTYQDVTNIDSIGIITARAGVDVNNGHIVLDSGYSLQWSDSHERIEQSDGKIEFFTNNTEKVTISGGSLGIGDVSPTYELEVASSDTTTLNITAGGNTNISRLFFSDGDAVARGYLNYEHNGDNLLIATAGSERLRITSAGNVGIGTNAPADILHLRNNAPVITTEATNASSGLRVNVLGQTSATSQIFRVQNDNSTLFTILKGGDVLIGSHATNYANSPLEVRETNAGGDVAIRVTNNSTTSGSQAGIIFTTTTADYTTAGIGFERGTDALRFYVGQSAGGGGFTNATERLRIDSAGNMGLGVTPIAPGNTALHIGETTSGDPVRLHMTTANTGHTTSDGFTLSIDGSSSVVNMIQRENAAVQIYTNNTSRVSVDNSGMTVNSGYRISTNATGSTSLPNPYSLGALASATIPSYPHFTGTWLVMGSVPCNNTWYDLLHSFSDSNGLFHGYSGDASSKNIFQYQYSITSPGYGVNSLVQRFMTGAWNTGSVSFQIRNNSGAWTLQIKATSYYNSSNNAGFRLMFHSYY